MPQAHFGDLGVELATQLMDARRAFAVHDLSRRIINRIDAIVFQNAAAGDAGRFDRNAVQRFDGKYGDSAELHLPKNQYWNHSLRGKYFLKNLCPPHTIRRGYRGLRFLDVFSG